MNGVVGGVTKLSLSKSRDGSFCIGFAVAYQVQ